MLNRRVKFFLTFLTSHRVEPFLVKHWGPRTQVYKSISWYYRAGREVTTNIDDGPWAALVFARRILTKRLSGQRDFWAAVDPLGSFGIVPASAAKSSFLPKAIGVQRRQKEHNLGARGCWHETLSSSISVTEGNQAAVGDCSLEKGRMLLGAMETGRWCGRSLMKLLVGKERWEFRQFSCLVLSPWG